MAIKEEVLQYLRKSTGDVSGEELSERLGISRTAVWKAVNALREEGYEIASATRRGYRLLKEPDRIDAEDLLQNLDTQFLGKEIQVFKEIDSTNEEVKRQALRGARDGLVIVSEEQNGGKGRLGRAWNSPSGTGLYFSFLLRPEHIPEPLTNATLLAGLGVVRALRRVWGLDAKIKWPNDVVIGNKKVCGILTEMAAEIDKVQYIVPGIGINVGNESFPDELAAKATSMLMELGKPVKRSDVLLAALEELDQLFIKKEFPLKEYSDLCVSLHKKVRYTRGLKSYTGMAFAIAPSGELMVRSDEDGTEIPISTGEVIVQGIYGQNV